MLVLPLRRVLALTPSRVVRSPRAADKGGAICVERTGRVRLFAAAFKGNVATSRVDAGVGDDIFLQSPKSQFGRTPIELFGIQTDRHSVRAFLGWPLVIDIKPITARCPQSSADTAVCGEQTICEDWPRTDTFPVRSYGLPAIGATCRCKSDAQVHGAATLEQHTLAPYGARWHQTVDGAFSGSTLQATCRLDLLMGAVQHKSSTVSVTLAKGEIRPIDFTLTARGQGHVPGAKYEWRYERAHLNAHTMICVALPSDTHTPSVCAPVPPHWQRSSATLSVWPGNPRDRCMPRCAIRAI